jgi:ElaB/YqjD/DUF883 family membrane-anchored ribosome-binding protein
MAARTNVRSVVSDAQDKGREAVEAVSEVRDNVAYAIDKSLKKRPYTTLGLTLALGFLLGSSGHVSDPGEPLNGRVAQISGATGSG